MRPNTEARTLEQVERIHIVDVIGRSRSSHNGVNERIQDGLEARFGIAFVANVWAPDDRSIIKAPGTCRRCRVALAQCMVKQVDEEAQCGIRRCGDERLGEILQQVDEVMVRNSRADALTDDVLVNRQGEQGAGQFDCVVRCAGAGQMSSEFDDPRR